MPASDSSARAIRLLTVAAAIVMALAYFSPIWWVSLTAPNYPKDAFPDGIRIHFHFNGVFNGCAGTVVKKSDVYQGDLGEEQEKRMRSAATQTQQLDCVHEMNTINHYVGMYPIEVGAPVERNLARYFFGFFAVLLLAFLFEARRNQIRALAAGFLLLLAWMAGEQFLLGQLAQSIASYRAAAGTFFNEPAIIERWAGNLRLANLIALGGLAALMAFVLAGVALSRRFSLLLALVPALLPVFFVIDYAGWLWFFGHNLHPWGAFTVKPFMPTVFGEGKVAQFSTYSYPYYGFALLLFVMFTLLPAVLLRRKQLRDEES